MPLGEAEQRAAGRDLDVVGVRAEGETDSGADPRQLQAEA